MFALVILTTLTPSAPAPKARPLLPPSQSDIVGHWQLRWGTSTWKARFNADGTYSCGGDSFAWVGHWHMEGNTLVVMEWSGERPDFSNPGYVWKVQLTRKTRYILEGTIAPPGPATPIQMSQVAIPRS